jgi:hypothetical protein
MAALIDKLEPPPPPPAAPKADMDLRSRLVDHLETLKRLNEMVRVSQVTPHHFRVNTLALRNDPDSVLQTYRFVSSRFLHVEDREGELVITDQTRR